MYFQFTRPQPQPYYVNVHHYYSVNEDDEVVTAFFTGASRGEVYNIDLVLYSVNLQSCENS